MSLRIFSRLPLPLAALLALLLPLCAASAESKVRGTLSSANVSVGEAVELEIVVSGDERASRPEVPAVDGLDISFAGGGQRSTMLFGGRNSGMNWEQTYTYRIVPKREGHFTIPSLEVRVGARVVKTLPATLTATPGEIMKEAGDLAFAKVWLPKKSLYVGEVVPMEVRLYLDATARWELRSMPAQSGDGFTTRPFGKPAERNIQLADKPYNLVTFSTVITPGKAGKISIGPIPANLVVSKPLRNQQRFDIFGRGLGPAQEMTVTAPVLEIDVIPLPAQGQPRDFSGAVGKFEFEATGTPGRVKVGEPVSMKLTIRGSGNFDRIGQPPLAEPDGWTTYSAKQEFQGSDSAGTEGVKTFELPVTPTARKTTMPVFAFSYFDPESAKYVTLKSAPVPLTVEGVPAVAAADPAAGKNPAATTEVPKTPTERDLLANLPDIGAASAAFGPSYSPAIFFAAVFAPVPVALALFAWRRRRADGRLARIAALRRERSALISCVKAASSRAEVLDSAVKAMRIHAIIETGDALANDDFDSLIGTRRLDVETEKSLRRIFDARTELLYAGAAQESDRIGDSERDQVMEAIASFERSPRR